MSRDCSVTIVTICDDWEFPTVTGKSIDKTKGKGLFPSVHVDCDGFPLSLSNGFLTGFISYFNPKEKNNRHNRHIVTNRIKTWTYGVAVENRTVTTVTPTVTAENTVINSIHWENTLKEPLIWTELKMSKYLKINNRCFDKPDFNGLDHYVDRHTFQRQNEPFRAYTTGNNGFSSLISVFRITRKMLSVDAVSSTKRRNAPLLQGFIRGITERCASSVRHYIYSAMLGTPPASWAPRSSPDGKGGMPVGEEDRSGSHFSYPDTTDETQDALNRVPLFLVPLFLFFYFLIVPTLFRGRHAYGFNLPSRWGGHYFFFGGLNSEV